MTSGARIVGVPVPVPAGPQEQLDETGYARTFRLDDALINLDQIATVTVHAPPSVRCDFA